MGSRFLNLFEFQKAKKPSFDDISLEAIEIPINDNKPAAAEALPVNSGTPAAAAAAAAPSAPVPQFPEHSGGTKLAMNVQQATTVAPRQRPRGSVNPGGISTGAVQIPPLLSPSQPKAGMYMQIL